MKRILCFGLIILCIFGFSSLAYGAEDAFNLYEDALFFKAGEKAVINGVEGDVVDTLTVNGVTLVPVRFIVENFGADVHWNPKDQSIIITFDGAFQFKMTIGSKIMHTLKDSIDFDSTTELAAAPRLSNQTAYVPLRAISVVLQKQIHYDAESKYITIMGYNCPLYKLGEYGAKKMVEFYNKGISPEYAPGFENFFTWGGEFFVFEFNQVYPMKQHSSYQKVGDIQYVMLSYKTEPGWAQDIYAIYPDGEIIGLIHGRLGNYIVDPANEYIYIVGSFITFIFDYLPDYEGNLYRIKIDEAKHSDEPAKELLGEPGYLYGFYINTDRDYISGYSVVSNDHLSLKDGYLYVNGSLFQYFTEEVKPTYKKYQIPITGRSHTVFGEADAKPQ